MIKGLPRFILFNPEYHGSEFILHWYVLAAASTYSIILVIVMNLMIFFLISNTFMWDS